MDLPFTVTYQESYIPGTWRIFIRLGSVEVFSALVDASSHHQAMNIAIERFGRVMAQNLSSGG